MNLSEWTLTRNMHDDYEVHRGRVLYATIKRHLGGGEPSFEFIAAVRRSRRQAKLQPTLIAALRKSSIFAPELLDHLIAKARTVDAPAKKPGGRP